MTPNAVPVWRSAQCLLAVPFALSLVLTPTVAVTAATITVGPSCTLVNAIKSANANSDTGGCTHSGTYGADTIILPFATYPLTAVDNVGAASEDLVASTGGVPRAATPDSSGNGLPVIASPITIMGNGSIIVRPLGASPPFFRFFDVSTNGVLTLNDLTISGGRLQDPVNELHGGAVRVINNGQLVVNTVTFSGNVLEASASGTGAGGTALGGAIYVEAVGQLSVIDAVFINNTVNANGAGGGGGGTALGGGIYVTSGGADIAVSGSVFTGNAVSANGGSAAVGGEGGVASGGAVYVESGHNLALTNVTITSNTGAASGGNSSSASAGSAGDGGTVEGIGVHFESPGSGNLTITRGVLSSNSATASGGNGGGMLAGDGGTISGGGLYFAQSSGTLSVTDTSFNHNTLIANGGQNTGVGGGDGGTAQGGGLFFSARGQLLLNRVSLSNNTGSGASGNASGAGGGSAEGLGLFAEGEPLNATLSSATLANNSGNANGSGVGPFSGAGNAQGGGLFANGAGTITLLNTTVSGNAVSGVPLGSVDGGGIHGDIATVTIRIQNSIVSGNAADVGPDCDAANQIISLGNNIIGTTQGCTLTVGPNDRIGTPPGLGTFTDGGTPASGFFPLNPGSPAIDTANSAACPAFDQLGQGRAGGCDIGAIEVVPATSLVTSILPISRDGQVGGLTLTAFVSIINVGNTTAFKAGIGLASMVPATFHFQTTNPSTNAVTGTPDTGADIPPGQIQTYVIAIRPTAAFDPTQLQFNYGGPNSLPVAPIAGLNTLLASASVSPIPDIVALAGTINGNGIVDISGATGNGVFTVATVNLGAGGSITAQPGTGPTTPAPFAFVCQTNPATAVCLNPPQPSVTTTIGTNQTPTFAVFLVGNGTIPFNPAVNRVSLFFNDAQNVTRGATGVAVRTAPVSP
jgi:hypothetical protein